MSLLRKTTQNPLPVCKPETGKNQYDIYPTHDLGPDKIFCDYTSLARRLAEAIMEQLRDLGMGKTRRS